MGTLSQLKARIATDLVRDDLTAEIANAIDDAIRQRESERFWFNQTRSLTLTTVNAQGDYGAADLAAIPNMVRLDALFMTDAGTMLYPLDRFEPRDFECLPACAGRPTAFTFIDDTIRLWPVPNAAYTLRLHAHRRLDALADGDSNAWTTEAVDLIRETAKGFLYSDPLRDMEGMQVANGKAELALGNLRRETSARISTGVIRPSDF